MNDNRRARALLVLGLLTAASFAFFAIQSRISIPYRDDWDWLYWVVSGPLTPARLFEPHNVHMIPLARLLLWVQYRLQGASGSLIFWLALGAQFTIVWVVARQIRRRWPDDRVTRQMAFGACLALLCFSWQLQSIVLVAAILFPLVQLLATAAIAAALCAADRKGTRRAWWLAAAYGCSLGAMLTTTNGAVVPVTLAALAWGMHERRSIVASHAGVALTAAVVFALVLPFDGSTLGAATGLVRAGVVLAYFAAFFAPVVTYFHTTAGTLCGAILAAAGLWIIVRTLMLRVPAPRIEQFAAALLLFVMGTAALAAVGRAPFGVAQSAQSRYGTFTMVYYAALVVAFMSMAARTPQPRAGLRRMTRVARMLAVPAMVVLFIAHVASGIVWMAKVQQIAAAGLAVRAGVHDEAWMLALHPDPLVIERTIDLMRGDTRRNLVDEAIGRHLTVPEGTPVCDGSLRLTRIVAPRGTTLRLGGDLRTDARRALIVDEAGLVVGLGQRAPLAASPDISRDELIATVRRAVTAGGHRSERWFGFARQTGTSYRIVVTADDGAFSCLALVTVAGPDGTDHTGR